MKVACDVGGCNHRGEMARKEEQKGKVMTGLLGVRANQVPFVSLLSSLIYFLPHQYGQETFIYAITSAISRRSLKLQHAL